MRSFALALIVGATSVASAAPPPNPQIDFAGFRRLAAEVEGVRTQRLIRWEAFATAAADPDVLILDARSAEAFAAGHIQGAVNLPLPDFTAESLARVVGRRDRPILIYCNNNFRNDVAPVPVKAIRLALNIQTFINLVGYGYSNVSELGEIVDFDDPRIPWVREDQIPDRGAEQSRPGPLTPGKSPPTPSERGPPPANPE